MHRDLRYLRNRGPVARRANNWNPTRDIAGLIRRRIDCFSPKSHVETAGRKLSRCKMLVAVKMKELRAVFIVSSMCRTRTLSFQFRCAADLGDAMEKEFVILERKYNCYAKVFERYHKLCMNRVVARKDTNVYFDRDETPFRKISEDAILPQKFPISCDVMHYEGRRRISSKACLLIYDSAGNPRK